MYTQGLDLLADNDAFCKSDYGITEEATRASIDASNARYGALRPDVAGANRTAASRILYVNGDVDPWSGLSMIESPSLELPTLYVPGASHHAWTHPTAKSDQPSVELARKVIRQWIDRFLAEP